ncbi:MAG: acyl carrier protein [Candidatus Thiodiazotropha sp. LLP2]
MSETFDFLTEEIGKLVDFEVDDMQMETGLQELGLVSLDYVSLQLAIRKKYETEINFDDFTSGEITTIGQFCSYIEDRMALA